MMARPETYHKWVRKPCLNKVSEEQRWSNLLQYTIEVLIHIELLSSYNTIKYTCVTI